MILNIDQLKDFHNKLFRDLMEGMKTISCPDYPNNIIFYKNNTVYFYYDGRHNFLNCNEKLVWRFFELEYQFKYSEIVKYVKRIIEKDYNLKKLSIWCSVHDIWDIYERRFNKICR